MTRYDGTGIQVWLNIYDLDACSGESVVFHTTVGLMSSSVCLIHAGSEVHFIRSYSQVDVYGDCPAILQGVRSTVQSVTMFLDDYTIQANGAEGGYGGQIDQVTGHDCYIGSIGMSFGDEVGATPDGQVFFRLQYARGWSDGGCPEDPYLPGAPGFVDYSDARGGYYTIGPEGTGWMPGGDYTPSPGSLVSVIGGAGPGRYAFPHRTDPSSLLASEDGLHNYIFHWRSLQSSAADVFNVVGGGPGSYPTLGSGTRNDTSPIVISTYYLSGGARHNEYRDLNGNVYQDRQIMLNYYPVHGFIGKWPVHHSKGRWMIYGPNTYVETSRPRWQVV
jgi:hypothetical protein